MWCDLLRCVVVRVLFGLVCVVSIDDDLVRVLFCLVCSVWVGLVWLVLCCWGVDLIWGCFVSFGVRFDGLVPVWFCAVVFVGLCVFCVLCVCVVWFGCARAITQQKHERHKQQTTEQHTQTKTYQIKANAPQHQALNIGI